jgi:hypothetical protein
VGLHSPVDRLNIVLDKMQDRDFLKSAAHGRFVLLTVYANTLAEHYFDEDYFDKLEETLSILTRCLTEGNGSEPAIPAIRSIALTIVTCGDESGTWFTSTKDVLKLAVDDASGAEGQSIAIHALASAAYFGGADYQEVQAVLDLLLDIVESDGEAVGANDNGNVVEAALKAWGFLSTLIDERHDRLSRALDAFEEQLESTDPGVLIAAAQNIALIHEQSYAPKESGDQDEEDGSGDHINEDEEVLVSGPYRRRNWTKAHSIGKNSYAIKERLKVLSKDAFRHVKKDTRKELHMVFRDVSHSLDRPWRGPRYSTAIGGDDEESPYHYGHRLRYGNMMIDRWWKLHRLEGLRTILQEGMSEHLSKNPNVSDVLRNCLQPPSRFLHSSDLGNAIQVDGGVHLDDDIAEQPSLGDLTLEDSDLDDSDE